LRPHQSIIRGRRTVAVIIAASAVLGLQFLVAPPADACHALDTTSPTIVPGGFTFEARATTSGDGHSGWTYEIVSSTPAGLTPTVTWTRIDAYPNGDPVGTPEPLAHLAGEGVRFTVSGLAAGDEVTVRAIVFIGQSGSCTGDFTSRYTRDVTGTVTEDGPPPAPPAPAPRPPSIECTGDLQVGSRVTCVVSDADPEIDFLWALDFGTGQLDGSVRTAPDGTGTFSFVVPVAAAGSVLSVALVEWTSAVVLGTVASDIGAAQLRPTAVAAGAGSTSLLRSVATPALTAMVGGSALAVQQIRRRRRMSTD
jgi:hypothetical protein